VSCELRAGGGVAPPAAAVALQPQICTLLRGLSAEGLADWGWGFELVGAFDLDELTLLGGWNDYASWALAGAFRGEGDDGESEFVDRH